MLRKKLVLLTAFILFGVFLVSQKLSLMEMDDPYGAEGPLIFVVTPTFPRPTQIADMTRLGNTLRNIPFIYWVVVDDTHKSSVKLRALLEFCNVRFVYLNAKTPKRFSNGKKFGRGVHNRNAALGWIRRNAEAITAGRRSVIYFADDDNAYDIRLFDEIQRTKKISMFPVGCVEKTGVSTPIVDKNGSLIGYHDPFYANRTFPIDMAGFAIGTDLLLNSVATFEHKTGYLEDLFLQKLKFNNTDIQFLANQCTQILVWHVKTVPSTSIHRSKVNRTLKSLIENTNLQKLFDNYA